MKSIYTGIWIISEKVFEKRIIPIYQKWRERWLVNIDKCYIGAKAAIEDSHVEVFQRDKWSIIFMRIRVFVGYLTYIRLDSEDLR
jgi:hypothetical protein